MICSAISSLVGCGTSLGHWLVECGRKFWAIDNSCNLPIAPMLQSIGLDREIDE
ncbi:hypothetical protein [Microcoleus asticus]|uniref:hypothetical protein n=1 Tax=Microcoleus asticus TaxID=2815231 RepID=UPI001555DF93|nr:hypothetical protein [Microcoleus asticus]